MGTALAIAGAVTTIAGSVYSGVSSYQQGKAQEKQANAEAANNKYQAQLENERASIAQIQGEQEAEKRSRALAADIGSTYANWAGNGLAISGGKDTLGSVINTTVAEGQADITNIRDNTAMNIWTHKSNANSLLASAENMQTYGKNMRRAGTVGAIGSIHAGVGSAGMGLGSVLTK